MTRRSNARRAWWAWIVLATMLVAGAFLCWFVFSRPTVDLAKVARAEARMWQAYYDGDRTQLALLLVSLLRNQYGLSLPEAKEAGERLAGAAMKFHAARGDYENVALGDLVDAYRVIARATGRSFDPEAVARAELAWWVARRTPGQNSVEQVGEKIAELYALLYGGDLFAFHDAGLLRAESARLRDTGGKNADWPRFEALLLQSYGELARVISRTGV